MAITVYGNAYLLDGSEEMEPAAGLAIVVEDGRIREILPAEEAEQTGFPVTDLEGGYLMPGLIDLSVRLTAPAASLRSLPGAKAAPEWFPKSALAAGVLLRQQRELAGLALASGVTTIRVRKHPEDLVPDILKMQIEKGLIPGPRILLEEADGEEAGGGEAEEGNPQEGRPQQNGKPVLSRLSPLVPGALMNRSDSHATREQRQEARARLKREVLLARQCRKQGIPVGIGSGAGSPFVAHSDLWRELIYFQRYVGVSAAFALHTATQVNAQIAGIGEETGTLEAGKAADFLVTAENPLENLAALRQPLLVVRAGEPVTGVRGRRYGRLERKLDKFL